MECEMLGTFSDHWEGNLKTELELPNSSPKINMFLMLSPLQFSFITAN